MVEALGKAMEIRLDCLSVKIRLVSELERLLVYMYRRVSVSLVPLKVVKSAETEMVEAMGSLMGIRLDYLS